MRLSVALILLALAPATALAQTAAPTTAGTRAPAATTPAADPGRRSLPVISDAEAARVKRDMDARVKRQEESARRATQGICRGC
jgi:hypothetical protein